MDEYGEIYCSVEKWCSLVNKLTNRQRKRLGGTGLRKMLLIPSVQMRKCLLKFIIKTYDATRKTFVMRPKNGDLTLHANDIFHIFGLENKGKDVMKVLGKVGDDAKERVPSRFLDTRNGEIVKDELIQHIVTSGAYDDDFVRRAVLVLLGTVIAPHSTKHVPHNFYKLVEHVDVIKSYNWNSFTLRVCITGITKTVKDLSQFRWPVGNLALIQVNQNCKLCLCNNISLLLR